MGGFQETLGTGSLGCATNAALRMPRCSDVDGGDATTA